MRFPGNPYEKGNSMLEVVLQVQLPLKGLSQMEPLALLKNPHNKRNDLPLPLSRSFRNTSNT
jgi:hypothetical protein